MAGPFLSSGAWVTTVTANDSTQKEELGILRFEGNKIYRYVRATAGNIAASAAVGIPADGGGTSVITVAAASTAASQCPVGIAETALTSGNYGWITVFGTATALVDTGARHGNALVAGTTAGTLVAPVTLGATVTGALNASRVIDALTTGVTTGSLVFVRCL